MTAHHLGGAEVLRDISGAVQALPPLPAEPDPLDLMLNAYALLISDGHTAAMPLLRRAADVVLELPVQDVLRWGWQVGGVRSARWNRGDRGLRRQVELVRGAGALAELPVHLQALALERAWRGDLPGARELMAEADGISTSLGHQVPPFALLRILALEGRAEEALPLIDAVVEAGTKRGRASP